VNCFAPDKFDKIGAVLVVRQHFLTFKVRYVPDIMHLFESGA
jgi:hypothetical protein